MKRLIPCRSELLAISWAVFGALALSCAMATGALAQHSGGHVGGASHVNVPPASHPVVSPPVTPVRPPLATPAPHNSFVRPPVSQVLPARGFVVGYPYARRPIRPRRPFNPIVILPPPGFGLFGVPFFGLGFGWGLGPGIRFGCDPFWTWNYGCNGLPLYGYGPEYTAPLPPPSNSQPQPLPQMEIQNWPVYFGEANSQFVQLYMKDGTVYSVTDYWLANGELHFKTVEENFTKVVEHEIDFGLLDLQMTIDVNTARGFRFVLRNEPLEQYLRDYPSIDTPNGAPTEPGSAEP
jgi:hypothetical protein